MHHEEKYQAPIINALRLLAQEDQVALHMPGHKLGALAPGILTDWLGAGVLQYDQTEIGALDSLHSPSGPIAAAERLAAELYQVECTCFTTNGSSAALIAGLMAATSPGDTILLPRNAHKSIISGLVLADLQPRFLEPAYEDGIVLGLSPETLQATLDAGCTPNPTAVLLVHPGFEGGCGDISQLVRIAHQHGCTVIVDEAHGSHFKFHHKLPMSATDAGADLVVQSAHKTLPALTGGAWVHLQGSRISAERLRQCINLVQSTSPSWLILGSLDAARLEMSKRGFDLLDRAIEAATRLEESIHRRTPFTVWEPASTGFTRDCLKVNLLTAQCGYTGIEVAKYLQKKGIYSEMSSTNSVLLMLTVADAVQPLGGVIDVLASLEALNPLPSKTGMALPLPDCQVSPRTAYLADMEWVNLQAAVGRVSARSIYEYPPGIPLIVPGQTFDQRLIGYITQVEAQGISLHGLSNQQVAVASL